jgi:hypothetical protein
MSLLTALLGTPLGFGPGLGTISSFARQSKQVHAL